MKKFSLIAVLLSAGILAACGGANQKAESAVDATKNAAATAVDAGKNAAAGAATTAADAAKIVFFADTATTEIYTLAPHGAIPIYIDSKNAPIVIFQSTLPAGGATLDRAATPYLLRILVHAACGGRDEDNI